MASISFWSKRLREFAQDSYHGPIRADDFWLAVEAIVHPREEAACCQTHDTDHVEQEP